MNAEAYQKNIDTKVTFIAVKTKLWTKGKRQFLNLIDIKDCDNDTLLIETEGPYFI
jgi:phosphoribosyl-AMP cyclohydrolase